MLNCSRICMGHNHLKWEEEQEKRKKKDNNLLSVFPSKYQVCIIFIRHAAIQLPIHIFSTISDQAMFSSSHMIFASFFFLFLFKKQKFKSMANFTFCFLECVLEMYNVICLKTYNLRACLMIIKFYLRFLEMVNVQKLVKGVGKNIDTVFIMYAIKRLNKIPSKYSKVFLSQSSVLCLKFLMYKFHIKIIFSCEDERQKLLFIFL